MAYTTIDKPSDYFNTVLYTGNGTTDRTVTGVGFQPDFVWIKNRTSTFGSRLLDSVRGATKELFSNVNNAETTNTEGLKSFDSDGFTLGNHGGTNENSSKFVSWNWLAGGTASSNTDGATSSNVSANTTAGFSIVSYTGTGSQTTIGHGLNSTPELIIIKRRQNLEDWAVFHVSNGAGTYQSLNTTEAKNTNANRFNVAPTSSVFTVNTHESVNFAENYIAWCFHSVKGYQKIGSYVANGNSDGSYIHLGFKASFLIIKKSSSAGTNWVIKDNKRSGTSALQDFGQMNPNQTENPSANLNNGENKASAFAIDILSNGFKLRGTDTGINNSGETYNYWAIAESPFVTSTGIPTTAR